MLCPEPRGRTARSFCGGFTAESRNFGYSTRPQLAVCPRRTSSRRYCREIAVPAHRSDRVPPLAYYLMRRWQRDPARAWTRRCGKLVADLRPTGSAGLVPLARTPSVIRAASPRTAWPLAGSQAFDDVAEVGGFYAGAVARTTRSTQKQRLASTEQLNRCFN